MYLIECSYIRYSRLYQRMVLIGSDLRHSIFFFWLPSSGCYNIRKYCKKKEVEGIDTTGKRNNWESNRSYMVLIQGADCIHSSFHTFLKNDLNRVRLETFDFFFLTRIQWLQEKTAKKGGRRNRNNWESIPIIPCLTKILIQVVLCSLNYLVKHNHTCILHYDWTQTI